MGSILFRAMAGGLAGFAAWLLCEPMFPERRELDPLRWAGVELTMILLVGLFVGAALGFAQGMAHGSRTRKMQWAGLGAVLGSIGSTLGYSIGAAASRGIFPGVNFDNPNSSSFIEQMMARTTLIAPIGLLIGVAIGMCGFTKRRAMVGALGGLIGGSVAGLLFDPLSKVLAPLMGAVRGGQIVTAPDGAPMVVTEIGAPGRAVTLILIGLAVGLFTAIFDQLTRSAWVRLVLGRNEGKEWAVDAHQTFLGRAETAHVPLFGDMNVAPMHALIQRTGSGFMLIDGGSPIGTYLNGQRIQQAPLFEGAQIQIGPHTLIFMLKAGAAARANEAARSMGGIAPAPMGAPMAQPPMAPPTMMPPGMPHPGPMPGAQGMIPTTAIPAQPMAPTMQVSGLTLVAVDGPLAGQRLPLSGPIELGREGGAVPLAFDSSVSRRHVRIEPQAGGAAVSDLGSTNGTFVNGQRISAATIRPGDVVKVGMTSFRLE